MGRNYFDCLPSLRGDHLGDEAIDVYGFSMKWIAAMLGFGRNDGCGIILPAIWPLFHSNDH